jgi:hypothetical protein
MTIADALQRLLDSHEDGWSVSQHVVCMGLERVVGGEIESTAWCWAPPDQPEWMTIALLEHSIKQREETEEE